MYKINEEKMFYDTADGIGIVIDFTTGIYYALNKVGTAVVDALQAGADVDAIAAAFSRLPNCPADQKEQIAAFVEGLRSHEILVASESGATVCPAIDESALADGFVPTFEEYSEIQDLVLADPIHEVDPDQGWPVLKKDTE